MLWYIWKQVGYAELYNLGIGLEKNPKFTYVPFFPPSCTRVCPCTLFLMLILQNWT